MRILIVDDEKASREAVRLLIDVEMPGCETLEADNGISGLEMIRKGCKPDIIFCDMKMPQLDGVELIQLIREEQVDCPIIVISGYDDFYYMRSAIQGKAIDYIRKPFIRKQFYEAFSKAVKESEMQIRLRQHSEAWRKNQLAIAAGLWQEYSMAELLRGEVGVNKEIQTILSELGIELDTNVAISVIIPRNQDQLILERYKGDRALFHFVIRNIFEEIFGPFSYFCRLEKHVWVIVSSVTIKTDVLEFEKKLLKCKETWKSYVHLQAISGNSAQSGTWFEIGSNVNEVMKGLLVQNLIDSRRRSQLAPPIKKMTFQESDFEEFIWLIKKAVEARDLDHATRNAKQLVNQMRGLHELTLLDLQYLTNQMNAILSSVYRKNGENNVAQFNEVLLPVWISDLQEWEYALVGSIARLIRRLSSPKLYDTIDDIREYIEKHFDQPLSLSGLAQQFHMSSQHLSRRFKESFQVSPLAMVIGLRVNKAKSLLVHTSLPIIQISNAVGYEDENYFSKVFKKATQQSPTQYRDAYLSSEIKEHMKV